MSQQKELSLANSVKFNSMCIKHGLIDIGKPYSFINLDYINKLNLGIHITYDNKTYKNFYIITDEKKWLLSKIKYEIFN